MTYLLIFDAMRCNCKNLKESAYHFQRYGKAVTIGYLEYIVAPHY
jgi:hypothetical protein